MGYLTYAPAATTTQMANEGCGSAGCGSMTISEAAQATTTSMAGCGEAGCGSASTSSFDALDAASTPEPSSTAYVTMSDAESSSSSAADCASSACGGAAVATSVPLSEGPTEAGAQPTPAAVGRRRISVAF